MWGWLALFGIEIFVQNKNRKIRAQNLEILQQSLAEGNVQLLPDGSGGFVIVQGETDPEKIAAAKAFREQQERLELERLEKKRLSKKRRQKWALIMSAALIVFALLFNLTSGMRERSKAGGQIADGPQVCYAPDHYAQIVRGIMVKRPGFKGYSLGSNWHLPVTANDLSAERNQEMRNWLHDKKLCTNPNPNIPSETEIASNTAGGPIAKKPIVCNGNEELAMIARGVIQGNFAPFKLNSNWTFPVNAAHFDEARNAEMRDIFTDAGLCLPAVENNWWVNNPSDCQSIEGRVAVLRRIQAMPHPNFKLSDAYQGRVYTAADQIMTSGWDNWFMATPYCAEVAESSSGPINVTPTKLTAKLTPAIADYAPKACPVSVSEAVTTLRALQKYKKDTNNWANGYDLSYFDYKSGTMLNDYFTTEVNGKTGLSDFSAKLFAEGLCLGTR